MTPQETLLYWIRERWKVYVRKENGQPKPWSDDPVFQRTYFCNVHRENDRITKWIRNFYTPYVDDRMFEYNIALSRFLNWPDTLERVGYVKQHDSKWLYEYLDYLSRDGTKIWGNAYVITTHGLKMPKAQYLAENVLGGLYERLEEVRGACRGVAHRPTCASASEALQRVEGIGSFLAGQIVADLKNTLMHPLRISPDFNTFVEPGPGSIKGLAWWLRGTPEKASINEFRDFFPILRAEVDKDWPEEVPRVDNQDLQNCLCEYDKYMRVSTGGGRSKRGYNGAS